MARMSTNNLILNSSIAQGLDIIGDRWTLLILREAFSGHSRFEEFIEHTGASRSTLSRRLKALVESDIFYKRHLNGEASRAEYRFTEVGIGLLGASLLAHSWDSQRLSSGQQRPWPYHTRCGNRLDPLPVCRHCQMEILYSDTEWRVSEDQLDHQMEEIRAVNSQRRVRDSGQLKADPEDLVYLIGDRWTLLILISAFFGISRYHEFLQQLNISPTILAERLKALVRGEILNRKSYQSNPPRHSYHLTRKGASIFPFIMALRQWAMDTLPDITPDTSLVHAPCGHSLAIDVVCKHCQEKPWPRDIEFRFS